MSTLDVEIEGVFGLVGVLLVFVAAYSSVSIPIAIRLLNARAPKVESDRERFRAELAGSRTVLVGLVVLTGSVLGLLVPLSLSVLARLTPSGTFRTGRAGLLLVDLLLCLSLIAAGWFILRLSSRIKKLDKTPPST
jgi:hypothetical protein